MTEPKSFSMFKKGQRWMSQSEPELGLGTLVQIGKERLHILFSARGELRIYAIQSAPLRRVSFRIGDRITSHKGSSFCVEDIEDCDGLLIYHGEGQVIEETQLDDRMSFSRPEDRLMNAHCDDLAAHHLRSSALQHRFHQDQSATRGFVGGRVELIPHQLYIASEVSARQAPRVLLSDEVGLGKTIEAALILHRLMISGRASRVLLVVPESLVHQWFVELFRKFNLRLDLFDEDRCRSIEAHSSVNPFLESQLILCSIDLLSRSESRLSQAISAEWDLLIVDEAHHLEWNEGSPSREYLAIETLSKQTEGLLLITATPEQLGARSHFARLRLLDPERYPSYDDFQNQGRHYESIAHLADRLSEGEPSRSDKIKLKRQLDQAVKFKTESDRRAVLSQLLDLHGPGRVIFRNTRSVISGFPKRVANLISIKVENDAKSHLERMKMEFEADAKGLNLERSFSLKGDLRVKWLANLACELSSEKILIISRSKEKALALDDALRECVNLKTSVFHEELSLIRRDRNAAYFAEKDGAQILICSEIGSEGRNFQFAHHLVLFDLPMHPERLEQRIGRLDRIGQKKDICIYIPFLEGSPQEFLSLWYHRSLDAFESHLVGGHSLFKKFGKAVYDLALKFDPNSDSDFISQQSFLKQSKLERDELSERLKAGRDSLLERSSFRPEVAKSLIKQIRDEDESPILEKFMSDVFEHYGVAVEELDRRTYRLCSSGVITDAFPAISKEGLVATYDRDQAIVREDLSLLSWDHPMVSGAMDLILGSELGNCCFAFWRCLSKPGLLLDATFELTAIASSKLHLERFLPRTPIRILIDHRMKSLSRKALPSFESGILEDASPYHFLDDESMKKFLPSMILRAEALAREEAEGMIVIRIREMEFMLDAEIGRLESLQKASGHVRPIEFDLAKNQKMQLKDAMEKFTLRLDSLRVIARIKDHEI